jgi:HEAT repeat protein
MWKVLLLLLVLGVVFVILLRLLERWSGQAKAVARPRREEEEISDETRTGEEQFKERVEELVQEMTGPDADRAREAASKLLMMGPHVIEQLMPRLLLAERERGDHEAAVVARRFEETLTAFGPIVVRPCLDLLAQEKGSFEVLRGVRGIVAGIGEAAARPLVENTPWLSEEGLYVRALLMLKSLGSGVLSAVLRGVEGGEGRTRELALDLLLDLARFFPGAIRERVRQAGDPGSRRGLAASAEVRQGLLRSLRRIGVTSDELTALRRMVEDEDPRVRREAWLSLGEHPEGSHLVAGVPTDPDPHAAAGQSYALHRLGLPLPPDDRPGQVAVARAGLLARQGDEGALRTLEGALLEGPLEARREASVALSYAGGEEAGRILARGLSQTPVPILAAVAQALGATRAAAAVGPLFDLWEERGGNAIRRAVAALGEAAVPKLMEYVSRRNPRLMEPAGLVLGELGAPARAALLALAREVHPEDPALFAVEVGLECQGAEGVEDVLPLLAAEEQHLVDLAVWVLAQIGDPRAAEPLFCTLERVGDRYPILDFLRRGSDEVGAVARRFLEAHPDHPEAEALQQAIGARSKSSI